MCILVLMNPINRECMHVFFFSRKEAKALVLLASQKIFLTQISAKLADPGGLGACPPAKLRVIRFSSFPEKKQKR
jgi:hypothetical protein